MCRHAFLRKTIIFGKLLLTKVIFIGVSPTFACEQPTLIFPAQHDDVVTARPVISWLPVASASGYEVSIQSRIPEGEVITQFSTTTVDTKYIPSAGLSRDRAIVSVKVRTQCGTAGASGESERIFFVDVRGLCPIPTKITSVSLGQFIKTSWEPNPLFDEVEVRFFGDSGLGALERVPRTQSFAVMPVSVDASSIVGVRSVCKEANSEWQWASYAK